MQLSAKRRPARNSLGVQNGTYQEAAFPAFLEAPPPGPKRNEQEWLAHALGLLYRRRWIFLLTLIAVMLLVAAYTFTRVPEYEAYSFIMVELVDARYRAKQEDPVAERSLFAENNRSLAGELFLLQTSTTIAERVYERLHAAQPRTPEQQDELPPGYALFAPAALDVNAILVKAVSPLPEEAALLANLYAEEYVRLTQDASRTYLSESRRFLEDQADRRRTELHQAEEQVGTYLRQTGVVMKLDQESSRLVAQAASLESQLDAARIELQTRRATLQSLEEELEAINPQLVRRIASGVERTIAGVQEKMAALESDREDILLRHPEMRGREAEFPQLDPINSKLQQLREELRRLSQQYVDEVAAAGGVTGTPADLASIAQLRQQAIQERIAVTGLQAKAEVVQQRLRAYHAAMNRLPAQTVELAQLERMRQHAEQMYQHVVERLQEARIAEESQPGYAQIIREAEAPLEPARPQAKKYLFFGLICGGLMGLGLALLRDRLDNRLFSTEALSEKGYEVVGVIPSLDAWVEEEQAHRAGNGRSPAPTLVTMLSPLSAIAESYRHARTSILSHHTAYGIQTLIISSPGVEEGKSTTAANLAVALAQAGRRTLLIDADLRRPQQHILFGCDKEPGLVQLLLGVDFVPEAYETELDNLSVIPAGSLVVRPEEIRGLRTIQHVRGDGETLVVNPAELLGSVYMTGFLTKRSKQFDFLLLDTPPMLAATDAMILATQCGATLLVARAGRTKEKELDYAREMLTRLNAGVVGVLLNDFDVSMAIGQTKRNHHYARHGYYAYPYHT